MDGSEPTSQQGSEAHCFGQDSASAFSLSLNRTLTPFSSDWVLQLLMGRGAGLGNDRLSCIWRCSGRAEKYSLTCIFSTSDSLSLLRAGPFRSSVLLHWQSSCCLPWLIQEYIKAGLRQTERLMVPRRWEDRSYCKKHCWPLLQLLSLPRQSLVGVEDQCNRNRGRCQTFWCACKNDTSSSLSLFLLSRERSLTSWC